MQHCPFPLEKSWYQQLKGEFYKPYLHSLFQFIQHEWNGGATIYPERKEVFSAFSHTPFDQTRVVIIGQDPYHGPQQAHGLCFSVKPGIPFPPSLRNIVKELQAEEQIAIPSHGSLVSWAKQGVLLLNATLTVRENQAGSHQGKGWEQFTDAVISQLTCSKKRLIFLLWGRYAQEKCSFIRRMSQQGHVLLTAAHPSPLSAHNGFFRCGHFTRVNQLLKEWGQQPIDWNIV